MTREEIIKLLQAVRSAYPTAKISDPAGLVDAWEREFGGYHAEVIYKATRAYMTKGKFFPTISDILKNITRGQLLYSPAPQAPQLKIQGEVDEDAKCRLENCILYHDLCNGLDDDGECQFEGI